MPRRSKIASWPRSMRERVDALLIEHGFGDYEALAERLGAEGYPISKSSLHLYGQRLQRREQAKAGDPVRGELLDEAGETTRRYGHHTVVIVLDPWTLDVWSVLSARSFEAVRAAVAAIGRPSSDGKPRP